MGNIVIRKRVSLDFLGEEYKDGYLEFKSIPLKDYSKYADLVNDETKAADLIISTLENNFIGGKFPGDDGKLFDVEKQQIKDFDIPTAVQVFKILTGQDINPKP